MSNKFRGGYITCTKQYVEQLPIKKADHHAQRVIANLVTEILLKKKKHRQSDTVNEEHEIDQLIYQLYGLTNEEIQIVENAVK